MYTAWVYILTNGRHTVLYVGFTTDMRARLWEHRTKRNVKSFTARYNASSLIYFEGFALITDAMAREKVIKRKTRKWKETLIASMNPDWTDLSNQFK